MVITKTPSKLGVGVAVGSGVSVGMGVGVGSGVGVVVGSGLAVGIGVFVGTGVLVGIGVSVGGGASVGVGTSVGTGVSVGAGVSVGISVSTGGGGSVGSGVLAAWGAAVAGGASVAAGDPWQAEMASKITNTEAIAQIDRIPEDLRMSPFRILVGMLIGDWPQGTSLGHIIDDSLCDATHSLRSGRPRSIPRDFPRTILIHPRRLWQLATLTVVRLFAFCTALAGEGGRAVHEQGFVRQCGVFRDAGPKPDRPCGQHISRTRSQENEGA